MTNRFTPGLEPLANIPLAFGVQSRLGFSFFGSNAVDYQEFLRGKHIRQSPCGFDVADCDINQRMFDWQRIVTRWSLRLGRAALFEDCGLGKTLQQLEWASQVCKHTSGNVLLLCPLAVQWQTAAEAIKFGIDAPVTICKSQRDVVPGITIANYEKLHHFDCSSFDGVVLDESSILKGYTGKIKQQLVRLFANTQFKLACTATPSPNDRMELGNHSEFLGVMPSNEMLARWFVNAGDKVGAYRLRKHGESDFWRWVSSWAVCISSPLDLGFDAGGYSLPKLHVEEHVVAGDIPKGYLFQPSESISATNVHREKRASLKQRADRAAELVNSDNDFWAVWCDTDYEADELLARIPDAIEVRGSHSPATKEELLRSFSEGRSRVIITKAELAGFGLNWQHCNKTTWFAGYSYERWYQALRRIWRFGQTRPVFAHVIRSESEQSIMETVQRKEEQHNEMHREMAGMMKTGMLEELGISRTLSEYRPLKATNVPKWLVSKEAQA